MTRKTLLAAAALVALALAPSYTAQTATAPGAVPTEPPQGAPSTPRRGDWRENRAMSRRSVD